MIIVDLLVLAMLRTHDRLVDKEKIVEFQQFAHLLLGDEVATEEVEFPSEINQ